MKPELIQKYLDLNEDELFLNLGGRLSMGDIKTNEPLEIPVFRGEGNLENDEFKDVGKKWFEEHYVFIKKTICENERINIIIKNKIIDYVHLVGEIISLFVHIYIEVHICIIAVIVVKKGISSICK